MIVGIWWSLRQTKSISKVNMENYAIRTWHFQTTLLAEILKRDQNIIKEKII
jgi:hypothetical protein